jgi:DNA-binding response OmpR family regulator
MGPVVLCIDDDPNILKMLEVYLDLHGFVFVGAGCRAEAMEFFKTSMPDVVLLDVKLPDTDGLLLCREHKQMYPDLPVIMLTAVGSVSDKVTGLEGGADDYVVKPFEVLELIARIRARLRQRGHTDRIVIGNLEVLPSEKRVFKNGDPVELTPKEFEILWYLIRNRRRVVSKKELKRSLWRDSDLYSWSKVIEVHIRKIREKIEDDPSNPVYIKTIKGRGYRFEGDQVNSLQA